MGRPGSQGVLPSDAWEDKVSDKPSADTGAGGSAFQAAKEAVASTAEQVRASAPGAYDAVGEATADHPVPVLLVTAALAFLAGYASHTQGVDDPSYRPRLGFPQLPRSPHVSLIEFP